MPFRLGMLQRLNGNLVQNEGAGAEHGDKERRVLAGSNCGEGNATSEQELIEQARQGDTAAFGELIKRHYNMCLKRASSFIHNSTDAEDEVQNACWKAFERLAQFRGDGSFSAWLNRIVENQCLMRIREDRRTRFLYDLRQCVACRVMARPGPGERGSCLANNP